MDIYEYCWPRKVYACLVIRMGKNFLMAGYSSLLSYYK